MSVSEICWIMFIFDKCHSYGDTCQIWTSWYLTDKPCCDNFEKKKKNIIAERNWFSTLHPLSLAQTQQNFWAFKGPKMDLGLIMLTLNIVIHRGFTGPIHFLSQNVYGPIHFMVCWWGEGGLRMEYFNPAIMTLSSPMVSLVSCQGWIYHQPHASKHLLM